MALLDPLWGLLATYALPIIVIILVLAVFGALKGWVVSYGEFWGIIGILALFVLLGVYALWAGDAFVGELLLAVGVLGLFVDLAASRHRTGRPSGRSRREE